MAAMALIVPRLLPRLGRVLPLIGGALMAAAIIFVLALIRNGVSQGPVLVTMLTLTGMGFGTLSGPLGPIVVSDVDRAHAGTASATLRTAQQLGGALGVAIVGTAYFSAAGSGAGARLAGLLPGTIAVVLLLVVATIAVSRLPANLFGLGHKGRER